ncbi:hypothetical protein C491_13682 [Natronococcus amylolyticus DSM 10524]|uniref:Uncharacterized protein n=1 Tax=Natronococcus amylolyticus DSM 10524 TaxID=1227497 RepID=L9X3I9_9EURY|nr:hypothetical protein C491_13682 [Natronococcus amylolyticus DSM 10524]
MDLLVSRTRHVLVLGHLVRLVGDRLVDPLECLFSFEEVVFFEELASTVGETVELPGASLSTLIVIERDLLYDLGIEKLGVAFSECPYPKTRASVVVSAR